jgi:hypothetical protein
MDTYIYDPSVYYGDEGESPTSTKAQIRFEFGAPASAPQSSGGAASSAANLSRAAMRSTAPAQTISNEVPLHDVNTRGTLWLGLGVTTLAVTVCMRRTTRFIGRRRFLMSPLLIQPLFTPDVPAGDHGRGSLEAEKDRSDSRGTSRHQRGHARRRGSGRGGRVQPQLPAGGGRSYKLALKAT